MSFKQHAKRDLLPQGLQWLLMPCLILGLNASDSLEVLNKVRCRKQKLEHKSAR